MSAVSAASQRPPISDCAGSRFTNISANLIRIREEIKMWDRFMKQTKVESLVLQSFYRWFLIYLKMHCKKNTIMIVREWRVPASALRNAPAWQRAVKVPSLILGYTAPRQQLEKFAF
jgi:hypothetical protein